MLIKQLLSPYHLYPILLQYSDVIEFFNDVNYILFIMTSFSIKLLK